MFIKVAKHSESRRKDDASGVEFRNLQIELLHNSRTAFGFLEFSSVYTIK